MSNKSPKPTFMHDCGDCIFIDTLKDSDDEIVDIYVCDTRTLLADKSLVVRYGDDESYYASYPLKVLQELRGMVLENNKDVELFQHLFNGLGLAKERNLI